MDKAVHYARCSTDDSKQDTDLQLKELRRFSNAYGWQFDEFFEYASGYKGDQPQLAQIIEKIRLGHYKILVVHSLDRFSREHPSKTNEVLNRIVHVYHCRFISLMDSIDSADEIKWNVVRHLFVYFANMFSRNLSIKVKSGIKNKKDKGLYEGGRPRKHLDPVKLAEITKLGLSVRRAMLAYNDGLPRKQWISKSRMAQVLSAQGAEPNNHCPEKSSLSDT